ncbi:MAG TPA: hypothetical protein VK541_21970 [Pedobacter sp.]|uniref:hypothetical protein n=1 Tax=Pedobacter sp. TaxID=1411316 RepID=UPI002BCFABD3|nr:hypothetical protein [Pedobacter sp.]HMI05170.1 hypothetical protein [Pedobacter sp.]
MHIDFAIDGAVLSLDIFRGISSYYLYRPAHRSHAGSTCVVAALTPCTQYKHMYCAGRAPSYPSVAILIAA